MAVEYKTFKVSRGDYSNYTSVDLREEAIIQDVDEEIKKQRQEGWQLRGSPWTAFGSIFLTMWRGD